MYNNKHLQEMIAFVSIANNAHVSQCSSPVPDCTPGFAIITDGYNTTSDNLYYVNLWDKSAQISDIIKLCTARGRGETGSDGFPSVVVTNPVQHTRA